jgi:hypothetical protein
MLKLLEFTYEIEYKKGKENTVADALSRQFQEEGMDEEANNTLQCNSSTVITIPTWSQDVQNSYTKDAHCLKLLQELTINATSHSHMTLEAGILRFKGKIYIGSTTNLREKIFDTFHSSLFGGHSGTKVTLHKMQQSFYWPKLKQFVTEKIAACPICQISKTEHLAYPGLLQPLPIPTQKWSDISMDFIQGLPKSRGKEVILVVVDRLTKYAHFIPQAHPYSVQTIAEVFMNTIIKLHGPHVSIVSDRDAIFTSQLWKQLFSKFKTKLDQL